MRSRGWLVSALLTTIVFASRESKGDGINGQREPSHPSETVVAVDAAVAEAAAQSARVHPRYAAEIEPHFIIAAFDQYGAGLGIGARLSFPIWEHFPIKRIENGIALGVGFDAVRYAGYSPTSGDDTRVMTYAIYVPVYAQWNLWVGPRLSLFAEPTVLYRFANYQGGCAARCLEPSRVLPTASLGLRARITEHVAFAVRVGWPMLTLGGSWL
ncbi:MAG: hypothetical protein NVS3B20_02810 [Polyangiales bacterium]